MFIIILFVHYCILFNVRPSQYMYAVHNQENKLGAVHKGRPQSRERGVCPVRTCFGQRFTVCSFACIFANCLSQETTKWPFGFRVKLPRTQQANLPAYLHTNPFKCWTSSRETVICEYQLLNSFGLTRPGNRTQVYRLRDGHPNIEPRTS